MTAALVGMLLGASLLVIGPGRVRPAAGRGERVPAGRGPAALAPWVLGAVALATAPAVLPHVGPGAWLASLLAAVTVAGGRRRGARRRARDRRRDEVEEALVLLTAELAAGRAPPDALAAAATAAPDVMAEASGLAALGGDPTPVLRAAARLPGAAALTGVAAAWAVALSAGAPLATVLERVRASVAAEAAATREAAEQVAPVRATARVLAVLPVLGLGLGGAVGVSSVALLTRTTWGQACLLLAVMLVAVGLRWVGALVDTATEAP